MIERGLFIVTCLSDYKYIREGLPAKLKKSLVNLFGEIAICTPPDFTHIYPLSYRKETGDKLGGIIVVFSELRPLKHLLLAKRLLLLEENSHARNSQRKYNLNPGVFHDGFLFMASHKNGPRRAKLGANAWIEPQLRVVGRDILPLPWSFEEFRNKLSLKLIQSAYVKNNKQESGHSINKEPCFLKKDYIDSIKKSIITER